MTNISYFTVLTSSSAPLGMVPEPPRQVEEAAQVQLDAPLPVAAHALARPPAARALLRPHVGRGGGGGGRRGTGVSGGGGLLRSETDCMLEQQQACILI